jgi:hypothetical protein
MTEEVVDWKFVGLYRHLLAKAPADWRGAPWQKSVRREDGPGWKRDYFHTVLQISTGDGLEHVCEKAEVVAEILGI